MTDEENDNMVAGLKYSVDEPFGYFRYNPAFDAWVQNRDSNKGTPFYTRPQPAAWVGLTDEEMLGLLIKIDEHAVRLPKGLREFARAIEAAHGIKE